MNRHLAYFSLLGIALFASAPYATAGGTGKLSIATTPRVQIYLDEKSIGRSPIRGLNVASGRHRLAYESKKLGSRIEMDVLVREGRHLECSYNFEKGEQNCSEAKPKTASAKVSTTLDLLSDPPADVYLDDRWIGKSPLRKFEVTDGAHRVEFRNPAYEPVIRDVDVKTGESMEVKAKFTSVQKTVVTPEESKSEAN
ncbi:MAG: PEGA domain-containing protein [Pseudomonadota bacterium]